MQPKIRGYKKIILPKYTETQEEIKQELDMGKILKADFSGSPGLLIEMSQFLVDKIVERTLDRKDVRGAPFNGFIGDKDSKAKGKYSADYVNSLEFQAFNKSQSIVNLQLTGLMLSSIDVTNVSGNMIEISIVPDQTPKAFNHQTGDTVPHRPFFGVTNREISQLKREFKEDLDQLGAQTEATQTLNDSLFGSDVFSDVISATIAEVLGF